MDTEPGDSRPVSRAPPKSLPDGVRSRSPRRPARRRRGVEPGGRSCRRWSRSSSPTAGVGLEATLASLADQEYPSLSTLVIDRAAEEDPTARVAEVYPTCLRAPAPGPPVVHRGLQRRPSAVSRAPTFFLVCRDDVVVEPGAVRVLVEEAYRQQRGDRRAEDRRSRPSRRARRGRPHDRPVRHRVHGHRARRARPGAARRGPRRVLRLRRGDAAARRPRRSRSAASIRASEPGAADLDICWRARLVGARVVVAPDRA